MYISRTSVIYLAFINSQELAVLRSALVVREASREPTSGSIYNFVINSTKKAQC
jgi:hypothetical protein